MFQLIMSLCLSSCCWAFCSSLQTQFLAPSVIPRNSKESGLAKKGLAAAVPFWTWICPTSLRKGGSPTLQQQLPFSAVARILQSGCFVCWVYIQAGGRLEECRRASYKKKKTLQIALSAFPPPLCWGKHCQHESEVLTPPSPLPPFCWGKNSSLLQQPAVSVLRCGFLKGGSKLWCPVRSFSSSDFRCLAQLMENTGHLQKMIHPPKIVIIF